MLRLVVRRAWAQRRLLAAVVVLVAVATTLVGFYTLLLGVTGPRSFSEQVQRSQPDDVDVTAYLVDVAGSDLGPARQEARGVVRDVLAPLHPSLVGTATSEMRQIGESGRFGYLATTDAAAGRGSLTSGRWPDAGAGSPVEAVAPDAAARGLRLRIGDRLRLGPGRGTGDSDHRTTVVIVGTFRGVPSPASETDPLAGAGVDPAFTASGVTTAAYGPFLVDDAAFPRTGLDLAALRVDGRPDLAAADDASLRATVGSLAGASTLLSERVGDAAGITRVGSRLPATVARLHAQQAATRSALLVALLLDTILGVAALVLAGRLLADSRTRERDLTTALGLSPGQQVGAALVESVLLAVVSTVVAVPAAVLAHAAVTRLPSLRAARLVESPTLTPGLLVAASAGALLLSLVLVVSPLATPDTARPPGRRRAWARSGVDGLLLVAAAVAWWQLDSRSSTSTSGDALLLLAPAVSLAAVTVVAVRTLPPLFAGVAAATRRSRSLLPIALDPSALRLGAGTALVLLSLASAAAAFGVATHATWERSQRDQADLMVGADLSLVLDAPPTAADAARIGRAAGARGSLVSPVVARPLTLGAFLGTPGEPPRLVAIDARHAGALLRGRLGGGETWADVGDALAPRDAVRGVPVPADGSGVSLTGRAPRGVVVTAVPTLVVQDATGLRSTLEAAPVPLDGHPHPLEWSVAPGTRGQVVAFRLSLEDAGSSTGRVAGVSMSLRFPRSGGSPSDASSDWRAQVLGSEGAVVGTTVSAKQTAAATVLTTRTQVRMAYLRYEAGDVLATSFEMPTSLPVAVSRALADAVGTKVGGRLSATVGTGNLTLDVVDIVPSVPSAPGQVAVLADADTVSRALVGSGHLEPVVDAFWVSAPGAGATGALGALELGDVTTRGQVTADLTQGPLQVVLPVAYLAVAGSAVLLFLAGAALVVSADRRRRTSEIARLRALGLPRGGARRLVGVQHAVLLVALVVTGVGVGAGAALAFSRDLVRSEDGTAPVPSAVLVWPWAAEALLAAGLVAGCLVIAAVAATSQVAAADPALLREGE
ncbi:permease [Nocardioides sp. KIGAM211]|uniref:Permease n=1 Tax=Nocardioides luti TaxID=2761101 RepID=A0A7X0REW0_9ACTN|nr:FtsX-like permease family protein [Nocardioides luti]MBB6626030.1 permease [Nocardioides luti]